MAQKFSEKLRLVNLDRFEFTGDLLNDTERCLKENGYERKFFSFILFRLSFGRNLTVHTLTDGVVSKVKNTAIQSIPTKEPEFVKKVFS
jgi:hypothetical protein